MIGGDLNSKIGQQTEEDKDIMGKHSKGQRNQHGIYLSEFLKEERMFLCNTAFQHKDHHKKQTNDMDTKEMKQRT